MSDISTMYQKNEILVGLFWHWSALLETVILNGVNCLSNSVLFAETLQIAAKVVLDESVKCVEQELASLDQEFRIDRPPKIITQQGHQEVASAEAEAEFAD